MYGLIGKMTAYAGKRDELTAILLEGLGRMPGCLSYVVAHDPQDADAIWVTEVWDSREAWLALPAVKASIDVALPLILEMGTPTETRPVAVLDL